jgi:hypothetical protein
MKIRTITCHHVYNHGAYLQAYALVTYLKGQGHDAKIIDYKPPYLSGHYSLWTVPEKYKRYGLSFLYLMAKLPGRISALKRKRVMDAFYKKFMEVDSPRYHTLEELQKNPPQADLYIAGSDQIWNTDFQNGRDAAFYLDFGNERTRRISYAASFATEHIENGCEDFVRGELSHFQSISVREVSALRILRELGYEGLQTVDPVFLLNREEWDRFATCEGMNERYVLVYDFGADNSIRDIAQRIAQRRGWKIYSVSPWRMKYANRNFVNSDARAFVALVKNAQCVISNSFHGSAFALLYNKDFFVVNRADGLNTRMRDLLSHYGIDQRLISVTVDEDVLLSHIDYSAVNKILNEDIGNSKRWLQEQIECV